jgi:hypothetical protein
MKKNTWETKGEVRSAVRIARLKRKSQSTVRLLRFGYSRKDNIIIAQTFLNTRGNIQMLLDAGLRNTSLGEKPIIPTGYLCEAHPKSALWSVVYSPLACPIIPSGSYTSFAVSLVSTAASACETGQPFFACSPNSRKVFSSIPGTSPTVASSISVILGPSPR